MRTGGEPGLQPIARAGRRGGGGDPTSVEAERAGARFEAPQKSRLA
jgi:hypothetical protein